jgi:DNA-binding SARP family transcriptional activator
MVEDAREHYRKLVSYMKETLNIEPSRETRDLYSLIEQRL